MSDGIHYCEWSRTFWVTKNRLSSPRNEHRERRIVSQYLCRRIASWDWSHHPGMEEKPIKRPGILSKCCERRRESYRLLVPTPKGTHKIHRQSLLNRKLEQGTEALFLRYPGEPTINGSMNNEFEEGLLCTSISAKFSTRFKGGLCFISRSTLISSCVCSTGTRSFQSVVLVVVISGPRHWEGERFFWIVSGGCIGSYAEVASPPAYFRMMLGPPGCTCMPGL